MGGEGRRSLVDIQRPFEENESPWMQQESLKRRQALKLRAIS